jgi:hypothetical protein
MKLGTRAHLKEVLHKSLPSVCVATCVCHIIVAKQRLGKHVTAATNKHSTIKKFRNASLSMQSVSYQRKIGYYFFPKLLVSLLSLSLMLSPCFISVTFYNKLTHPYPEQRSGPLRQESLNCINHNCFIIMMF